MPEAAPPARVFSSITDESRPAELCSRSGLESELLGYRPLPAGSASMASTLTMLFGLWRRNRLKARLIRERLLPEVTMPLPTDIFPLGVAGSRLPGAEGDVVEAVDNVPSEPAD